MIKKIKTILILLILCSLTGCKTEEQIEQEKIDKELDQELYETEFPLTKLSSASDKIMKEYYQIVLYPDSSDALCGFEKIIDEYYNFDSYESMDELKSHIEDDLEFELIEITMQCVQLDVNENNEDLVFDRNNIKIIENELGWQQDEEESVSTSQYMILDRTNNLVICIVPYLKYDELKLSDYFEINYLYQYSIGYVLNLDNHSIDNIIGVYNMESAGQTNYKYEYEFYTAGLKYDFNEESYLKVNRDNIKQLYDDLNHRDDKAVVDIFGKPLKFKEGIIYSASDMKKAQSAFGDSTNHIVNIENTMFHASLYSQFYYSIFPIELITTTTSN